MVAEQGHAAPGGSGWLGQDGWWVGAWLGGQKRLRRPGTTQARRVRDDLAGGTCWREHCSSGVWRRPWERGPGNSEAS